MYNSYGEKFFILEEGSILPEIVMVSSVLMEQQFDPCCMKFLIEHELLRKLLQLLHSDCYHPTSPKPRIFAEEPLLCEYGKVSDGYYRRTEERRAISNTNDTVTACLMAWELKNAICNSRSTTPHFSKSEGVASSVILKRHLTKQGCWVSKFTFFCLCLSKYCNNFLNWRRLLVNQLDSGGTSLPEESYMEDLHK
ncbi:hypothetical protein GCK32_017720, partial [Trichostrongylus colubriformis]